MDTLRSENITLSYGANPVVINLSTGIRKGEITTILGPNGCGKSTLLRALARLMRPDGGSILLDGQEIHRLPTREVAKRMGLMQQQPIPPDGITVENLVRRGRYPHQGFLQPPSQQDTDAVENALRLTGIEDIRDRSIDQLSGGQRQRAWMAMAIAQETPLLLLDEPTTYLDIRHQMEILELVQRLNREAERTIVMVLHDVNEAARISDRIIALRDGQILCDGAPADVLDAPMLSSLYGIECDVFTHPLTGAPFCLPQSAVVDDSAPPALQPEATGFDIRSIRTGYGKRIVLDDISLSLPPGKITAIIGPNACGKSTLLRTCSRLLKANKGEVQLDGCDICRGSHRKFARKCALLTQGPTPPAGFLVEDLVSAGRAPYQSIFHQWRPDDERAVEAALERCAIGALRDRDIDTLSGGQRQRAWMALALAQDTPVMLLDEPTTFLDIAAQIELLDLAWALNRQEGRTIIVILHDLNMAARYADLVVALKDGRVVSSGTPDEVMTTETVREIFGIESTIITDPLTARPLVMPYSVTGSDTPVVEELLVS